MQSSPIRDLVVGLFVLAGLGALGYLTFQVGGLSYRTAGGLTLYAAFDDIGGLKERSPVSISGVKVGQVAGVQLDELLRIADTADLVEWIFRKDVNCLRYLAFDSGKSLCENPNQVVEHIVVTGTPKRLRLKDVSDLVWDPSIERMNRVTGLVGATIADYMFLSELDTLINWGQDEANDSHASIALAELAKPAEDSLDAVGAGRATIRCAHARCRDDRGGM